MTLKYKKSYRFAIKSTSLITIFSIVILLFLQYLFFEINFFFTLVFAVLFFVFSFFVIQFRVEKFIYHGIENIFNKVSILDKSVLRSNPITTDMQTLMSEVNKFATDKKIEIESLKVREEYRREFIGNVAHELKTPLFTVQGYISTLIDGEIEDEKIIEKYLKRAENGVERLIEIVADLDMITKLESSELKLDVTRFDIVEAFKDVFDMFELKAEEKDIALMFDKENYRKIFVKADKEKISRAIVNLVENSIKYGKPKGTTEVSFVHLTDNKLMVRVTDDGLGIDKKHINRIFERFYRIESSRSREVGGSGLGLSIVKHIIEAHDEHIYLESKLGSGSEFSFTIQKSAMS
ncbi:sensor histidine kinase [Paenimyroides tangerinum]|uniref:histidine kinase n=1 Tax=Paenimyroides tangerinum TaxID=2488728 RepID=A0A3P3W9M6_9FLAO|nr:ATP-binding protein [Paenimyroides tangerinum]RRJ91845.1 sensor histidine kinase [Paenimyroides tangerinum]